jgi:hypothetical protein
MQGDLNGKTSVPFLSMVVKDLCWQDILKVQCMQGCLGGQALFGFH